MLIKSKHKGCEKRKKSPQTIYTVYIRKIARVVFTGRLFIYGKYRSSIYNQTQQL